MVLKAKNIPQARLTKKFSPCTRDEYFQELADRIAQVRTGQRTVVATMTFKPELPGLEPVLTALNQAAKRGAKVDLIVDAYAFMINNTRPGPLFFHKQLPANISKPYKHRLRVLEQLKRAGGHYAIINWPARPFKNPFGGRSHLKFAILGERVYIGGCNLSSKDRIDVMVGWDDAETADWLYDLAQQIIKTGNAKLALESKDTKRVIDSDTTFLLDAGVAGQSLIYAKAIELIDSAREHILLTCQYFPNNTTIEHLIMADKRGVKVKIIYNHPSTHPFPLNLVHYMVRRREKLRCPQSFFEHELPRDRSFLHAKVLVSEKAAMVGSHNYVTAGVRFGTAEITLHNTNAEFGRMLVEAVNQQL